MLEASYWKGIAAGVVGGAVGSLVMQRSMLLLSQFAADRQALNKSLRGAAHAEARVEPARQGSEERLPATFQAAQAVAEKVLDRELDRRELTLAGPGMHYAFGMVTGAMYGLLAEHRPSVTAGAGAVAGTAVWVAAEEVTVPLLRLSAPPWKTPVRVQLLMLLAHLVYGVVTEAVRRTVRHGLT